MKQLYCAILLTLLAYSYALSQTNAEFYYNEHNQLTTQDKASIRREAAFDMGQLQFNGPFRDYDKTGNLIAEGNYSDGIKKGVFKTFRNNELESEIEFTDNEFVIREWKDQAGQKSVVNGTGTFTMPYFFVNGRVIGYVWTQGLMHGEMRDGKRVGKWVYENEEGQVINEEIYNDGAFVKRSEFIAGKVYESKRPNYIQPAFHYITADQLDLDASAYQRLYKFFELYPVKGAETLQRDIAYPGGMTAFMRDIAKTIKYPIQDARAKVQGQVIVSLVVDEKGQLKDAKVIKSVSPTLDAEAIRAIKVVAPKLTPALLDGKPYESVMSIPVSFRIG